MKVVLPLEDGEFKIVAISGKEDRFKVEINCKLNSLQSIYDLGQVYSAETAETNEILVTISIYLVSADSATQLRTQVIKSSS